MGATLTPMLRQYKALKHEHPDAILLYRMGDFYEMFYEDAQHASRLLELTLTARGKGTQNAVPMCGFPHHQLEPYTARLIKADQRVAICDQVEDPKQAKGLVKREVVRIVTPGTMTDPTQLDAKSNVWIASAFKSKDRVAAAFLDLSTGEFFAWDRTATGSNDPDAWRALADRLRTFAPREVLLPDSFAEQALANSLLNERAVAKNVDDYLFQYDASRQALERQLKVGSLDGFGFRDRTAAVCAAGALLQYVQETQRHDLKQIHQLNLHDPATSLSLDAATQRNLEIERSARTQSRDGSLLHAIDRTATPAGARLLRGWLLAPLLDVDAITRRQDAVAEFASSSALREITRERLRGVLDIERLLTRTVSGSANARDLGSLRGSLRRLPDLIEALATATSTAIRETVDNLDPCDDLRTLLDHAIVEEPPATHRDGGLIREGYNDELDELRLLQRDGRQYISSLELSERESTGINSLKVKYNKVFGYFIEISKSNLHLVPDSYVRKQTIANGERFITPELKEYEAKVLTAQERIEAIETELFNTVRTTIADSAARLREVARATATLDVLSSFAELAVHEHYSRPKVHDGEGLTIRNGRHPVVEQSLIDSRFIPNDARLGGDHRSIGVLTGPNMGGKSTYLRQVAIIALLAQTGSFVPADEAELGLVDRIFCRVGASDSLSEGQSTFMVEMTETANILHHVSSRSLLLLDEIGRGTSTFDGLSIAWAVVEHLHQVTSGAPRTLFATHYHELTELAVELDSVANLRMAVRERGEEVAFLHRVEDGASDRSYGIQVARLAGVPSKVVERAKQILANLERDEYGGDGLPRRARAGDAQGQPTLFGLFEENMAPTVTEDPASAEVLSDLRGREVNDLTPLEALNLIAAWKKRLSPKQD